MRKKKWLAVMLAAALVLPLGIPADVLAAQEGGMGKTEGEALQIAGSRVEETAAFDGLTEDLPGQEELLEGYLERIFWGGQSAKPYGSHAADILDGVERRAYEALKAKIGQIASGERASAVIELSLSELGITQSTWTAEDLGVDAIVKDQAITEEAVNAWMARYSPTLRKLMRCLLIDCPLDLYWYDKTVGVSSSSPGFGASLAGGKDWTLHIKGGFTYRFCVAEEYQDASSETPSYTVDASDARLAQAAAENARRIAGKYAASGDYDRLCAYRREICELVSYNHAAADNPGTKYGNPWQLIWVFDGDDTTNVVCEGYAKAFQYLCDLTEFHNPRIACYSVSGVMAGGTGSGRHMWNVVTMNDTKNYIVDVTNCDAGTVGADDRL